MEYVGAGNCSELPSRCAIDQCLHPNARLSTRVMSTHLNKATCRETLVTSSSERLQVSSSDWVDLMEGTYVYIIYNFLGRVQCDQRLKLIPLSWPAEPFLCHHQRSLTPRA